MLAAKRAAEQDAERAWQQQRFVKIANCQSASKNPSSTYQCGPTELPSSVNHPCSVEQASAVDHTSAAKLPITIYWLPDNRPHGYRDASACLPGSYTFPRLSSASSASSASPASCASGASTATPANTTAAAVAARVQSDGSFTSTSVHETRY
ncbi:hypothetical protein PCASD_05256 [Puccinia coronata f. sp. avenae]|uniref:Uncharacterized protein n=1 Tax=Puccinia coronata f. sp. avenae TaxID=200324 RepID=A0A2N5UXS1_9BASI|nr:hypothetical protein PCASD_05256 [Puccinia coronata f. sp. avenae]